MGADNDGKLPLGTGYRGSPGYNRSVTGRAVRNTGDYFDVLVPEYLEPPEVWYCSRGAIFPDTGYQSGVRHQTVNSVWDFDDHQPRNASFPENIFVDLMEKAGYTDIPRKLSDPGDWVVVNDDTIFDITADIYPQAAHPGFNAQLGIGRAVRGRNGLGAPRGINTGTVDGSVKWTPQQEAMLGWPTWGGDLNAYLLIRAMEPSRPGRPGMLP